MDRHVTAARPKSPAPPVDDTLPPLREDLALSEGPTDYRGRKTWLVYDALRHRFAKIDDKTRAILGLWPQHKTKSGLVAAVSATLDEPTPAKAIEGLLQFLAQNHFLEATDARAWRGGLAAARHRRHSFLMALLHNYLFFRIPLFSPERWLRLWAPSVTPLFSRWTWMVLLALGVTGLYVASRQWDDFLHGARLLATPGGIAAFGVMIFVVKIFHELGHAFAANRYGCRVPVIGIASMMGVPLLYTDVTDAWRLRDKRQRLVIDGAGIAVELAIACLATFLWVFMENGVARQFVFLAATTSWVTSLAVNLNPFMRFDGYYIAADLLGVENLQTRSFDLGRWQMRELLFKLRAPPPEVFAPARRRLLTGYAWAIWVYRLVVFTGIAVAVYSHVFKALGIVLFAFEIGWFIVRPMAMELAHWAKHRRAIMRSWRTLVTGSVAASIVAACVVPWSSDVALPALLMAGSSAKIFPLHAGRIVALEARLGDRVAKGDPLLRLEQPDLDAARRVVEAQLAAVQLQLGRVGADAEDRRNKLVLVESQASLVAKLAGLNAERENATLRAPMAGIVAELDPELHVGRWIGVRDLVALVRSEGRPLAVGYVPEQSLWRLDVGARGVFIADAVFARPASVSLESIAVGSARLLDVAELGSTNGGSIEVQPDNRQGLVPVAAQYRVTLSVADGVVAPTAQRRGTVHLSGRSESLLAAVWRQVLKVLVREANA